MSTSSVESVPGLTSNESDVEFLVTASEQAENVENSSSQSSNVVFTAAGDHFEAIEALAQSEDSWEKHVLRENSFKEIKSLKCLASMSVFGSLAVPSLDSLSFLANHAVIRF